MTIFNQFLGSGLDFPVLYDRGRLKTARGIDSVVAAITMLFGTRKGIRFMQPAYGSNLHRLLFQPCNSMTAQLAAIYAREDILEWIPRIERVDVQASTDNERSAIRLEITFRLRNSAVEAMMIYPFYLEAVDYQERQRTPEYVIISE